MARITASINLSKLGDAIRADPSITFSSAKGDRFININIWVNPDLDKYDHDVSLSLAVPKDHPKLEQAVYIGNGRTEKAWEQIEQRTNFANERMTYTRQRNNNTPANPDDIYYPPVVDTNNNNVPF